MTDNTDRVDQVADAPPKPTPAALLATLRKIRALLNPHFGLAPDIASATILIDAAIRGREPVDDRDRFIHGLPGERF